jgi:hypothetical protein
MTIYISPGRYVSMSFSDSRGHGRTGTFWLDFCESALLVLPGDFFGHVASIELLGGL